MSTCGLQVDDSIEGAVNYLPSRAGEAGNGHSTEYPPERTAVRRLSPEARRGRSKASIHRRPPTHFHQLMQWDTIVVSLNCHDDFFDRSDVRCQGKPSPFKALQGGGIYYVVCK